MERKLQSSGLSQWIHLTQPARSQGVHDETHTGCRRGRTEQTQTGGRTGTPVHANAAFYSTQNFIQHTSFSLNFLFKLDLVSQSSG